MTPNDTAVIARMIASRIKARQWRSETVREVSAFARAKGADKAAMDRLLVEVRRMYDEAGAGFSGRFQ